MLLASLDEKVYNYQTIEWDKIANAWQNAPKTGRTFTQANVENVANFQSNLSIISMSKDSQKLNTHQSYRKNLIEVP